MADATQVVVDARWHPYVLALRRAWKSARGATTTRNGWLLVLRDNANRRGYGDCAPLKGAGTESVETAKSSLRKSAASLIGQPVSSAISALPPAPSATPAVRCACETALLDLAAHDCGLPLHRFLSPDSSGTAKVNAMIGTHPDWPRLAREAVAAGFTVLKLKLGVAEPAAELAALRSLIATLPRQIRLRLDINRGWSLADAWQILPGLDPIRIEAVEEPAFDADEDSLRELQAAVAFSIALDESLARRETAVLPVLRQVLKPMAVGGLLPILERAAATRIETIVTTTVDSAVGVRAACHVAAALGNDFAHGLATSDWLKEDFLPPPRISAGLLFLPDRAGLGIDIDIQPS